MTNPIIQTTLLMGALIYASALAPTKTADSVNFARSVETKVQLASVRVQVPKPFGLDYDLLGGSGQVGTSGPEQPATPAPDPGPGPGGNPTPTPTPVTPAKEKERYLIYFTATWCGPCHQQKPVIEAIQKAGKYKVKILDYDANPEAVEWWGVTTVPHTEIVFDDKRVYKCREGGQVREELEFWLEHGRAETPAEKEARLKKGHKK